MRPCPGGTSCSRQALPPIRFLGYWRFVGLRSFLAVSSVASGRIEFVSQAFQGPQFYGLSVHFQLLSTSPRGDAVTFSYWREAPPGGGLHPPLHALSPAHERGLQPASACQRLERRNRRTHACLLKRKRHECRAPPLTTCGCTDFDGAHLRMRAGHLGCPK